MFFQNTIIQSPLFIFSLSLIVGIVGYYIKHFYHDRKQSKLLKILEISVSIEQEYYKSKDNKGYLPPTITLKLENLSKTDIEIKRISFKHQKVNGSLPIDLRLVNNITTDIKQYEVKSFTYDFSLIHVIQDENTHEVIKDYLQKIETPMHFIKVLTWYLFKEKELKKWKELKKKIFGLRVDVFTNIGDYGRKLNRKEIKSVESHILSTYNKHFTGLI
ncbi:hypothetical protein [Polaribacter sp.]|uniref:hypothetical protein n=1 Tax=Polaribacter sp. TaxID=1920175 RepID=UPI003EF81BED